MHDRTIKQKEKEKMNEKKKRDSRVKTQKGSLERKWKDFEDSWVKQTKEWRVNNQEASEASTNSSIPSKIRELEPSIQECLSWIPESITVGLDACQITIFKD